VQRERGYFDWFRNKIMILMIEDTRVKFLGHFSRAGCVRREGRDQ